MYVSRGGCVYCSVVKQRILRNFLHNVIIHLIIPFVTQRQSTYIVHNTISERVCRVIVVTVYMLDIKILRLVDLYNSFLTGWRRNRVYVSCYTIQMADKTVQQSRQLVLRAYCPNLYNVLVVVTSKTYMWQDSSVSHEILGEYKKNYGGAHDQIRHQLPSKFKRG